MILFGTKLITADNTDIRQVRCIKILGNSKKKKASLGDVIRISIYKRQFKKELIKKKIYLNLIINMKKLKKRSNGIWLKFDQNRSLNLSEQFKFLGTRIYGPICKEIKDTKKKKIQYKKLISYSYITL